MGHGNSVSHMEHGGWSVCYKHSLYFSYTHARSPGYSLQTLFAHQGSTVSLFKYSPENFFMHCSNNVRSYLFSTACIGLTCSVVPRLYLYICGSSCFPFQYVSRSMRPCMYVCIWPFSVSTCSLCNIIYIISFLQAKFAWRIVEEAI